jgi:trimethylamine monooxygenase
MDREALCDGAFDEIDFQANHMRDLKAMTTYFDFDIDRTVEQWKEWEHDKDESIVGYRNKSFRSPVTATPAPPMATPWLKALDDSMETFLNEFGAESTQSA